MHELFNRSTSPGLVFNLRSVEKVDYHGSEWILDSARRAEKGALLGRNLSSYFIAEHMRPNEPIPIFEKEVEVIEYFGEELAVPQEGGPYEEKRLFQRIKVAVPAELALKEEGDTSFFDVAVLNLSEGGLSGKFLDSKTEELAKRKLDPFNLKMLTVSLRLTKNQEIKVEGKVLRTAMDSSDVGDVAIEFYKLTVGERERLRHFLENARVE